MEDKKPTTTIKERLTERFVTAREIVGQGWKTDLSLSDPFFDTKQGSDWMNQASGAVSDPNRINNDRLERVVLALEDLVHAQKAQTV
jgi:hypothetical protein